MGKGKGGRAGIVARVSPLTILLAFSALRPGLYQKIKRKIQVRCNFKVGGFAGKEVSPIRFFLKTPKYSYILSQYYDLRYFFRKTNQTHIYFFVTQLFYWFKNLSRIKNVFSFYDAIPQEISENNLHVTRVAYKSQQLFWSFFEEDELTQEEEEVWFVEDFDEATDHFIDVYEWSADLWHGDDLEFKDFLTVTDWAMFNHFNKDICLENGVKFLTRPLYLTLRQYFSISYVLLFYINALEQEIIVVDNRLEMLAL